MSEVKMQESLQQQLEVASRNFRALFSAVGEACFVVDLDMLAIIEANDEARRLTLGTAAGSLPRSFAVVCPELHGCGPTVAENRRRIEEVIRPSREFAIRRADGVMVPCEGNASVIEYDRQPAVLVVVRGISERKKLEEQLRQSEKLSTMGQLVAGVAHELNNPLAVIMGYAQILTSQEQSPGRMREDVRKILHESERAAKIVRNLITFARPRAPQLMPVDLNQLLGSVAEACDAEMESNAIVFSARFSPSLPRIMADAQQLEQVFTNLFANAIQALAAHRGRRLLEVITEAHDATVRITVADSGPGIATEIVSRVFDPFFTTKGPGKGTGLGLSVCHSVVQAHNGRIWVETEPGKGARFQVDLPLAESAGATLSSSAPRAVEPQAGALRGRVLLVDDEPGIIEVLRLLLEETGCVIESAVDGEQALQRISTGKYDLIISDLCMPNLGGEALYEQVRKRSPELAKRIIFITGDTVSATSRTFLDRAGNRWFGKPFSLDEIEKAVREFLATPMS